MTTHTVRRRGGNRLVYLIGQLGPGGRERQLYTLLENLDRQRYNPAVIVWNHNPQDHWAARLAGLNIPVLSAAPRQKSLPLRLMALRRTVREMGAEILHSYSFYTNFYGWTVAQGTPAIPIGSFQSGYWAHRRAKGPFLGRLCSRYPRFQISNNRRAVEEAESSGSWFRPERMAIVPNGVRLDYFSASPLPDNEEPLIVGLGSLVAYKRWELLIVAAGELARRGLRFRLTIAGEGPERRRLQDSARREDVADRLDLPGMVNDVPTLLARCSFLVHTSDVEGLPNTVLEAMACGRAVVATDAGDLPYLIEDGTTGFVVPRGDIERLSERMAVLLADRQKAVEMGRAGRKKAEAEYGVNRLVSETLAAYREAGWRD